MDEDPPHVMPGINSFILLFAPDIAIHCTRVIKIGVV